MDETLVMKERAMQKMLSDPSFDIKSIDFLLNLTGADTLDDDAYTRGNVVPYSTTRSKKFKSLSDYEEVSNGEVMKLRAIIRTLRTAEEKKSAQEDEEEPMDEDNMCSICYAREISVIFNPCNHSSCKACIRQHMMTSQECFYCKAIVESISDIPTPDNPE